MNTKNKKTTEGVNGTPRKLKALPDKDGPKKATELPSDIGTHEKIVRIPLDQIDLSPYNKRGSLKQEAIEEMAASIKKLDVLQAIVVRLLDDGRYQLVFGERRFRGAQLAGLVDIPCVVRAYTDEQVIEVQWAENFEREEPHFMDVAGQIREWLVFRSLEEIAARMGRPVRYAKDRKTLLSLVPDIEVLARADKFSFKSCLVIAGLAASSQQDFYDKYCASQKDAEKFYIEDLEEVLESYQRKLARAPFDIKDALLLPFRGACTVCPLNSACASLFPEDEKDATCADRSCYTEKVEAHRWKKFQQVIVDNGVTSYLQMGDELTNEDKEALSKVPDGVTLAVVRYDDITCVEMPEMPDKMDYVISDEERFLSDEEDEDGDGEDEEPEEEEWSGPEEEDLPVPETSNRSMDQAEDGRQAETSAAEPKFDEDQYASDMAYYQEELDEYHELVKGHEIKIAIGFDGMGKPELNTYIEVPPVEEKRGHSSRTKYTSKEVNAAIKAGTATVEMVQCEKDRIEDWIKSKEKGDEEIVQQTIHSRFGEFLGIDPGSRPLTATDDSAVYWYIFKSLGYGRQTEILKLLFPDKEFGWDGPGLNEFKDLDAGKKALLVHIAIFKMDHSSVSGSDSASVLVALARQYLNIEEIRAPQDAIGEARRAKKMPVLAQLSAKLADLDPDRPKEIPDWAMSLAVEDCADLSEFIANYKQPDLSLPPNEGAEERSLYSANEELKKLGYVTIYSKESKTQKMVTFVPKPKLESALVPIPGA